MIGRECGLNDREEKFVSCFKRKPGGRPPGRIILHFDLKK